MKEIKVKKKEKVEEVKKEEFKERKIETIKKAPEFYVVKQGETIDSIAKKFNTTADSLIKANGNINPVGGNQIVIM